MSFAIGMIGLDTSHSVEFPRLFQSDSPGEKKINGVHVTSCLRFPSAFCNEETQDERQAAIEKWGVKVSRDVDEVLDGVDGIMIEINDPALHLRYLRAAVAAGKPIFLDKPPAATLDEAIEVFALAAKHDIPFWSASSLRFAVGVQEIRALPGACTRCTVTSPLGKAAAGSDVVWYGVHGVEMLVALMGTEAVSVRAHGDSAGVIVLVGYGEGRRGLVELTRLGRTYSGEVLNDGVVRQFTVAPGEYYYRQMLAMQEFFLNGVVPVPKEDTLLVQAILNAVDESLETGKEVILDV